MDNDLQVKAQQFKFRGIAFVDIADKDKFIDLLKKENIPYETLSWDNQHKKYVFMD